MAMPAASGPRGMLRPTRHAKAWVGANAGDAGKAIAGKKDYVADEIEVVAEAEGEGGVGL